MLDGINRAMQDFQDPKLIVATLEQFSYASEDAGLLAFQDAMASGVDVILGPSDDGVFLAIQQFERDLESSKRLVVSPVVTTDVGNERDGWMFRTNVGVHVRATRIYDFLSKRSFNTIAVIYEAMSYGDRAEVAFRGLLRPGQDDSYLSVRYRDVVEIRDAARRILQERPAAVGLFGSLDHIRALQSELQEIARGLISYNPLLFTIVDARTLCLDGVHFVSVAGPGQADCLVSPREMKDEVTDLSYNTTAHMLDVAKEIDGVPDEEEWRVRFRDRFAASLEKLGEQPPKTTMVFSEMESLARVLVFKDGRVYPVDDSERNWFSNIIDVRIRRFGLMLLLNLVLVMAIVAVVTVVHVGRSHPGPMHRFVFQGPFLLLLLFNTGVAVTVFVTLAETGVVRWDNAIAALGVAFGYTIIRKTTFYDQIIKYINKRLTVLRYELEAPKIYYISYTNSRSWLKRVLANVYAESEDRDHAEKRIEAIEKEVEKVEFEIEKRRVYVQKLLDLLNWEQIVRCRLVPPKMIENEVFDPRIVLREAAEYCTNRYPAKRTKIGELVENHKGKIRERSQADDAKVNKELVNPLSEATSDRGRTYIQLEWILVQHVISLDQIWSFGFVDIDYAPPTMRKKQPWLRRILVSILRPFAQRFALSPPAPQEEPRAVPEPSVATDLAEIPLPNPPRALQREVALGRCVVVVGSGMSARGGLMTWTEMLAWVADNFSPGDKNVEYYHTELDEGRVDPVAESLRSVLGAEVLAERISALVPKEYRDTYEQMRAINFAGVINLNFDTHATGALDNPSIWSHNDARNCLDQLSRGEPFVMQLNGTVGAGDMLFSNQDLQDVVAQNAPLRDLLRRLYYSHTLFFLGVSLSGVQNFFRLIERSSQESSQHFALIEAMGESFTYASQNLTQFGVEVLPFGIQDRDVAIRRFLSNFEATDDAEDQLTDSQTVHKISRVELRNIGPFVNENFEFDADFNVILGDNGVGKSTILRAVAVCACGGESASYADRMLRRGATSGEIVLYMGSRKYVTIIEEKTDGGVTVQSMSGVPYQLEGVLMAGFSALRGIGWERPKGRGQPGPARPTANDILPLITGEQDPRLEGVKQLILRLHHSIESKDTPAADKQRYQALHDRLFDMFSDLAHGVQVRLGEVNPQTSEINIVTQDGPVPFEALSQGTLSLVSWTGALLQRLYETARQDTDPMQVQAVVLIDEIDAHMHPAWQRSLLSRLRRLFPNVQFIATSHSPLMVGSLEPNQVYHLLRDDDGLVIKERPDYALKGLGAAGLLTSNLFGLNTHLDEPTEDALNRKRELVAKVIARSITLAEEAELKALDEKVGDIDFTRSLRDQAYQKVKDSLQGDDQPVEDDTFADDLTKEQKAARERILNQTLQRLIEDGKQ